ncbi:23S rRNA (adenine(2030)-N(6))-methyltransferase RlmJ [Alteromonas sp. ASW11-130]|uniref:23S rRNA (adenine(2030)-N(6))-methyltransferase RlmJ n=1 Tax=Alteromonas sp. ASW11-130 TaxID=3015775 RepID=UPI002242B6D3|nr:23S rRNA (adenine(2030)-N(6))-methyltransferase RlmJ [Alteromonas sp. ASW11-130]
MISYLKNKDKPFTLFDTHAGAGLYPLDSEQAQMNSEFKTGISTVIHATFASDLLTQYQSLCASYWDDYSYPGSPLLAANLLRLKDKLQVMELHPNEVTNLKNTLKQFTDSKKAHVHHRDGLEGLVAMVPPPSKRGAVLIDPPYERKEEYQAVVKSVSTTLRKWRNAQIIIWYPLLSDRAKGKTGLSERLVDDIVKLKCETLTVELIVDQKSSDTGMYGSGVCIVNPSWGIDKSLSEALDEFCQIATPAVNRIQWYNRQ